MNDKLKKFIDSQKLIDDDTLYKIGLMHKDLEKYEKNWNELADYLDLEKSGEGFRSWVNYRQAKDGTLIPKLLYGNPLLGDDPELTSKLETLHKERVKTRDVINTHRNLIRDEARLEQFKSDLQEAVSNLPSLPKVSVGKTTSGNKTEAVMLLSDLHIGVDCNNFYNTYNDKVAIKRISKYTEETIKYCKANNVERLNILNLGDMVHGLIHVNSRIDQQMDVVSQVMKAAEIISSALNLLQEAAPEVIYRSCSDNHSRLNANKSDNIERENFGRLIDWFLEERLKDTKIKFINDNLDFGIGRFNLKNGKRCAFMHGHQDNVNSVLQNMVGATKEYIDYIFLGHYHTAKMKTFQNVKVFVNGSIVGTEEYALSKRYFSDPEQLLLIFDNNNVLNYNINLS